MMSIGAMLLNNVGEFENKEVKLRRNEYKTKVVI